MAGGETAHPMSSERLDRWADEYEATARRLGIGRRLHAGARREA